MKKKTNINNTIYVNEKRIIKFIKLLNFCFRSHKENLKRRSNSVFEFTSEVGTSVSPKC